MNRRVVVVVALEPAGELVGADAGGDDEAAQVVGVGADRRDKVGERQADRFVLLLARHREPGELAAARGVGWVVDDDLVFGGRVGREEPVGAVRSEQLLGDDAVEQRLAIGEDLTRGGRLLGIVEDRRVAARELPGVEERRPVDPADQLVERHGDVAGAQERRHRDGLRIERQLLLATPRLVERQQRPSSATTRGPRAAGPAGLDVG